MGDGRFNDEVFRGWGGEGVDRRRGAGAGGGELLRPEECRLRRSVHLLSVCGYEYLCGSRSALCCGLHMRAKLRCLGRAAAHQSELERVELRDERLERATVGDAEHLDASDAAAHAHAQLALGPHKRTVLLLAPWAKDTLR